VKLRWIKVKLVHFVYDIGWVNYKFLVKDIYLYKREGDFKVKKTEIIYLHPNKRH
jgi:hypothetical protein